MRALYGVLAHGCSGLAAALLCVAVMSAATPTAVADGGTTPALSLCNTGCDTLAPSCNGGCNGTDPNCKYYSCGPVKDLCECKHS